MHRQQWVGIMGEQRISALASFRRLLEQLWRFGGTMPDEQRSADSVSFHFTTMDNPEFEPFYLAVGKLALGWSTFEVVVNDAIWELANVERLAGTCMTSQLIGPGPRFRCLVSLLNLREVKPELINAFNSLASEAESLGRQRNRCLHDPLVLNIHERKMYRMETTADRKLRHDFVPVEIEAVTKLTEQISSIDERFEKLFGRVIAESPPWPRSQYQQSWGIQRERFTG
jgi:hypothetical protein